MKKVHKSRGFLQIYADTGDVKYSVRTTAPDGWVRMSGLTIGSGGGVITNYVTDNSGLLNNLVQVREI